MTIIEDAESKLQPLKVAQADEAQKSPRESRTYEQKLACLRKAVSNSKEHLAAGDPPRVYSQYIRYALDEFRKLRTYTSIEAHGLSRDVVREHVVPHSIVMDKLLNLDSLTDEKLESVLQKYFSICVITKAEDLRLTAAGFRSKMPPGWDEEAGSIFARYDHEKVKISIQNRPPVAV